MIRLPNNTQCLFDLAESAQPLWSVHVGRTFVEVINQVGWSVYIHTGPGKCFYAAGDTPVEAFAKAWQRACEANARTPSTAIAA